jgi:ubiquitin C-terminal hydrolase
MSTNGLITVFNSKYSEFITHPAKQSPATRGELVELAGKIINDRNTSDEISEVVVSKLADLLNLTLMTDSEKSRLLADFKSLFTQITSNDTPSPQSIVKISRLSEQILHTYNFDPIVRDDISDCIEIAHALATPLLPPAAPVSATDLAVGFSNMGSNCWANSLLSLIFSTPSFLIAYMTVGDYYAQKGIDDVEKAHGERLIDAFQMYQEAKRSQTAVSSEVSQSVRLAFCHLFRNPQTNRPIFSDKHSDQEDAHEALQSLMGRYEMILKKQNKTLPTLYCSFEQVRTFRPIEGQPSETTTPDKYSKISGDNTITTKHDEYQICLDPQMNEHLPFPLLLDQFFAKYADDDSSEPARFLRPDGQLQNYQLIQETHRFEDTPNEFVLTLKKFIVDENGNQRVRRAMKIDRRITLPPSATAENKEINYSLVSFIVHIGSTSRSGHYLCYKLIDGKWIEVNDSSVRIVSEKEIDQILHGERGATYTSYVHHYVKAKEQMPAQPAPMGNVLSGSASATKTKTH